MKREALTNKIAVVGVDGFDPKFAKRCMDKGLMPNLKKYIEKGACREDLTMLGGMPTVTPPMWTTLATGANASTMELLISLHSIRQKLILLSIIWIPEDVKQSNFGMYLQKLVKRHWYGISLVPAGLQPLTARICQ